MNHFKSKVGQSYTTVQSPSCSWSIRIFNDRFYCKSKFMWVSQPPQGCCFLELLNNFVLQIATHWCSENSWSDCHHSDFKLTQISCHGQCHSENCTLTGSIDCLTLLALKSCNTCYVNDDSSLSIDLLLWGHDFGCMLGHVESANNVNFENFKHFFRWENTFWSDNHSNRDDPSTVDDSTDFTKLFDSEIKEPDNVFFAADVSLKELTSWKLLSKCGTKFFIQISDNNLNSERGKMSDGSLSESRRASCDNCNQWAVEFHLI